MPSMSDAPEDPLDALREHSRKAFGFMIGSLLINGEPALLAQARQARGNAEQSQCYDAIRELRLKGQLMREFFVAGVLGAFDASAQPKPAAPPASAQRPAALAPPSPGLESLGIVKDSLLEQQLAVDNIASRSTHQHREALLSIGRQLARRTGSRRVDIESLPVSPQTLASVFMEACARAAVEPGAVLMFSRLFTRFVIDELGPFYQECKELLPPEQEHAEPAPQAPSASAGAVSSADPAAARAPESSGADSGWDVSRTPLVLPPGKAMAMPMNQLDAALAQVQENLLDPDNAFFSGNPKAGVQPLPVQELLNDALAASGVTRAMSLPVDAVEAMRMLRLLFEHVLRDNRMPPAMRRVIRLLEVPLLRVALRDSNVLSAASHPARAFFGELTAAAAEPPTSAAAADDFPRLVQLLVMRVLGDYEKDLSVFAMASEDLRRYLGVHGGTTAPAAAQSPTPASAPLPPVRPVAPAAARPPASPEFITLVDKIPLEGWIELRPRGAERRRLQLVGRVPRSTTILFADESGQKAGEWSRNDLASMIENGEAVILKSGATQPPGRR